MESLEELFGISEPKPSFHDEKQNEDFRIVNLKFEKTVDFPGHPFKVQMDEAMAELIESVREHGILHPGIARPTEDGTYETIAGHRRKYACRLAGRKEMPFIIRNYSDDEATVIMVESNIQRPTISVKEKAFAYRMHMEAQKRINAQKKRERTADSREKLMRSDEILAKKTGESRNTIQRYIRLTYLIPELMDFTDEGKIPFIPATELSYLRQSEQEMLLRYMQVQKIVPSGKQALALKARSAQKTLTEEDIEKILTKVQAPVTKIVFRRNTLSKFFPENYKQEQIEDVILSLLKDWAKNQQSDDKDAEQIPGQTDIMTLEGGKYMP